MIDRLQRYETDGEASAALRVNLGRDISAAGTDRYFQITFSRLAGVNCNNNKKIRANLAKKKKNISIMKISVQIGRQKESSAIRLRDLINYLF